MQPIRRNSRQRPVIKHNHRVRILRQPPHRQHTIVRMHDHISRVRRIRKNAVRLYNLLRKPIIQFLEQERSQTRARTTSDGVQHHEAFQRVAAVRFAVNHLHDVFVHSLSGLVSISPVVRCSNAVLPDEEVLGIVDVFVRPGLDTVDDLCDVSNCLFFPNTAPDKALLRSYANVLEALNL